MKIKNKIVLGFSLIFVLVTLSLGLVVSIFSNQMIQTVSENSLDSIVRLRTDQVENFIGFRKKLVSSLASNLLLRDYLGNSYNKADLEKVLLRERERLLETQASTPEVVEFVVVDATGKVLVSTGKTVVGSDQSTNENFVKAKTDVSFRDIYISDIYKQIMYAVSAPFRDNNGRFLGVLIARFKPNDFYEIMGGVAGLGVSGESFLVNKDYYFITPSKYLGEKVVLEQKILTQNVRNCFDPTDKAKVQNYIDYRGVSILGTHGFIPETGWCVIGMIDSAEVFGPSLRQGYVYGALSIVAIILFVLVGFLISGTISRPIEELSRATEVVGNGDLDYQLELKSKDEIGDLARSFNKMIGLIKESRSSIDLKVHEQTKSIEENRERTEVQQRAIINVLEDVEEERRVSEQRALDLIKFRQAVENATDHMVITDADGIILYANKAVSRITGFLPEEIIGRKAGSSQLWGGLMSKEFYTNMWKQIKVDKLPFGGEVTNKRKNGEKYIALASISPILDKTGKVVFFVGVERDVTKEKEVDKMKTEFVSLVTHQLRSPITAVKWGVEMLLSGEGGELNDQQKEILKNVEDSNEHMDDLVGSLLNISRIESGRIMIEPEMTDLSKLVRGVITEIVPQTTLRKVTVDLEVRFTSLINVDPKLTREVYKNFLTNAVKYSRVGGNVKVLIEQRGEDVVSNVTDSGYGIPKEEQVHIFQKFYRASNIIKEVPDGTGLGLYLTKQIVEASGGKVGFESEDGKGTTFWFTLPVAGVVEKKGEVSLT